MTAIDIQTVTTLLQAVTTLILVPLFKYAFLLEKRLTILETTQKIKGA
jgi:hypothetical protein